MEKTVIGGIIPEAEDGSGQSLAGALYGLRFFRRHWPLRPMTHMEDLNDCAIFFIRAQCKQDAPCRTAPPCPAVPCVPELSDGLLEKSKLRDRAVTHRDARQPPSGFQESVLPCVGALITNHTGKVSCRRVYVCTRVFRQADDPSSIFLV